MGTRIRLVATVLLAVSCLVLAAGCERGSDDPGGLGDASHAAAAPIAPNVAGGSAAGDGGNGFGESSIQANDPLAPPASSDTDFSGGDPLARDNQDPFAGSGGGTPSHGTYGRPHDVNTGSGSNGGGALATRYWMRGSVYGGRVRISFNHLSIGTFSTRIDQEITDQLRPGYNDIDFEHQLPVHAHIEIVRVRQAPGIPDTHEVVKLEDIAPPASGTEPLDWRHPVDPGSWITDTMSFSTF